MSSSVFKSCLVFLTVLALSDALSCYQCQGAEDMPSVMSSLMATVSGLPSTTNATKCNSANVCSTGTYCMKTAYIYSATIASKSYNYTIFNKGCITPASGVNITSGTCIKDPLSAATTTYNVTVLYCYCNNKDQCNGVDARSAGIISVVLSVIALMAFY